MAVVVAEMAVLRRRRQRRSWWLCGSEMAGDGDLRGRCEGEIPRVKRIECTGKATKT